MLEELKNLEYPGRSEDIAFFLTDIIGKHTLPVEDVRVICAHAPGGYQLRADALIPYCTLLGWATSTTNYIQLDKSLYSFLQSFEGLTQELIARTLRTLFATGVFSPDMFRFDTTEDSIVFRNELLPLNYSAIRNVLISQKLFFPKRSLACSILLINPFYEDIIACLCKEYTKATTLKQLRAQLEQNAVAGAAAEEYVFQFEKKRITRCSLSDKIKIISELDVSAGYDIISFHSNESTHYDRFIEVKAISKSTGFFWTKNEYEIARSKATQYCLYLVDLSRIKDVDYEPLVISNPASEIMFSDNWLVESQTYYVQRILDA